MTDDRIQTSCLDEKKVGRKTKNSYRKWLEKQKKDTKQKYTTDIGPLFKEGRNNNGNRLEHKKR